MVSLHGKRKVPDFCIYCFKEKPPITTAHYLVTVRLNIDLPPIALLQPEPAPALVKKIGKTTYKVRVHFSNTSTETMSDKIKRMLKNEIQQM